ncbi:MAG: hypothetical protein DRP42_00440 [Tenericutes bacterium]|nr:MAG: hypothetical protein DRP42_00440 [Mycoplasmatota bacterium]
MNKVTEEDFGVVGVFGDEISANYGVELSSVIHEGGNELGGRYVNQMITVENTPIGDEVFFLNTSNTNFSISKVHGIQADEFRVNGNDTGFMDDELII